MYSNIFISRRDLHFNAPCPIQSNKNSFSLHTVCNKLYLLTFLIRSTHIDVVQESRNWTRVHIESRVFRDFDLGAFLPQQ